MIFEKTQESVVLNNGETVIVDVVSDVGPSSSSKKAATVRNIMGMMQATADPETIQVLSATAMMNMEGEGIW